MTGKYYQSLYFLTFRLKKYKSLRKMEILFYHLLKASQMPVNYLECLMMEDCHLMIL